ncbi:phosphoethanolamine transferase [Croceitalea marina]|uniref:Phosphoethanolamine transferase n=1 Tax=Croceitalea marina TaxID=1775166 RepID=A0ABW5MY13_9FLAO
MLIVTIPYCIFQKKIIYQIGLCIYFLIGFIEIGHWITMKAPMTITSLLIISNTNFEEAVGFLDMKSSWDYILLIIYTAIFVLALRKSTSKKVIKNKLIHIGTVVIIFFIVVFRLRNSIPKYRFLPQSVKISYAFIVLLDDYKKEAKKNKLKTVDAALQKDQNQQQTFVLIIGETCSRRHMSLYGSKVDTNPKLSNRNDIIKYTDVVSGYNYTIHSVPAMLSQSNLENKLSVAESIDLLDIFHSAGFETFWISNQSPIGMLDNVISAIARKSDYTQFVNTNGSSSGEAFFSRAHDGDLLEPFESILKRSGNRKFIVLHLMGSHHTYNKRYPPSFERFKGGKSKKERLIDEYHNSIYYNDFVVDSILSTLNKYTLSEKGHISSAIYLSDHGENVYDETNRVGHGYSKEMPKILVEIPFIVWLSSEYMKKNKNITSTILGNKNMPYVSDDFFHSVIDINNIKSPLLDETKSVFNKKFNHNRKRVLIDGKDYDRK